MNDTLYGHGSHGPGCLCPLHEHRNREFVIPEITDEEREAALAMLRKLAREFDLKMKPRKSSARRTGALMR